MVTAKESHASHPEPMGKITKIQGKRHENIKPPIKTLDAFTYYMYQSREIIPSFRTWSRIFHYFEKL